MTCDGREPLDGMSGEWDRIESVLLARRGHDGTFAGAEVGDRRFAEEAENDGVTASGQLLGDGGVADDGGGSFEAAFPAGSGGVADEQALGGEAGGDQHGLADALEVGPAGDDADQICGVGGHVALEVGFEFRRDGMDLEGGELGARREQLADGGGLAGQDGGYGAVEQGRACRNLRERSR